MAWQVLEKSATIPAGTLKTAPTTIDIPIGTYVVERIRWRVPPGPNGTMGWALAMANTNVIPVENGSYIVANDESDSYTLENLLTSGAWQVIGYNTGIKDHTVYFQFLVTPVAAVPAANTYTANIPVSTLSGS